ncbi:DHHC palmitoyltransferase-domain-containing protein [Hygrophoropsis aurantiaca]|uniref:DHHC palmitoyltransferase-domain-containing protein n=1 Tax=Hygrophoropsis aurantiaca TaxID=72124 RepID=A0ACB8ADL5_9AGAM|nr:DHHC palmitoyltransferase-domain-containing protein [Hygrophoropsis aurantiaca]
MTKPNQSCCGVIEEARIEAREKHDRRAKPQPWIVLKLAVGLTVAIIGYSSYVYIGTFCLDMIRRNSNALGNEAMGVAFLVVFCIFLFMMLWSYTMVVITPPGFARDFVEANKSGYGLPPTRPRLSETLTDIRGPSYELMSPTVDLSRNPSHDPGRGNKQRNPSTTSNTLAGSTSTKDRNSQTTAASNDPEEAGVANTLAAPIADPHTLTMRPESVTRTESSSIDLPPPMFSRRPPTTPILLPEYRYCNKEKILKPHRAHHCRACGACVLRYDHHCPWVGQCVGAFNHKFFVNFIQWACVFCFWTFGTLLGVNLRAQSRASSSDINPQQIVVIALAALFGLFTMTMIFTQTYELMVNQTTVESLGFRAMKEREKATLSQMHALWQMGAKRQTKRRWDNEWGKIGTEGNLWWLGSARANWESVMGRNVWWWFLPIGHRLGDGLTYPTNPRFDSEGRWRRRREWPSDLR